MQCNLLAANARQTSLTLSITQSGIDNPLCSLSLRLFSHIQSHPLKRDLNLTTILLILSFNLSSFTSFTTLVSFLLHFLHLLHLLCPSSGFDLIDLHLTQL